MNKYEVLGVVGEGAYGVVYKAKNKETGEYGDAALTLSCYQAVQGVRQQRLSKENLPARSENAENGEAPKHRPAPRSLQTVPLSLTISKGILYLVFEYMDKSMLEIIEKHTEELEEETVKRYVWQLLKAVDYCHRCGVVHRDVKPENLLVSTAEAALKICDFGFARTLGSARNLTEYVATRWYRAPELLLGSDSYGKEVDCWAIGCIMGELADGQPLFPGESEIDQLYLIQKVLGPLTPEQMEAFLQNPRFLGFKFPEIRKLETLEKRYAGKLSKGALQVMKGLLAMNPKNRLTCKLPQ